MVEKYRPFSARQGLLPKQIVQIDDMNERLRNRLHTEFMTTAFHMIVVSPEGTRQVIGGFFGRRVDVVVAQYDFENVISDFFARGRWDEIYDLLEFTRSIEAHNDEDLYNVILEEERSGWRFVGGKIVPITSMTEINAIESALQHPIQNARDHIENALKHLADRPLPDYAGVVGDAIQAVEAVVRVLTGEASVTLGDGLKKLRGTPVHPALLKSYSHLYGWSSDEGGARHAFKGQTIDAATAKHVLVQCSSFIGYLTEVAASPPGV